MFIKHKNEVWNWDTQEFSHLAIIISDDDGQNHYYAHANNRHQQFSDAHVESLSKTMIPPSKLWPPLEAGLIIAPCSVLSNGKCYIKQPSLIGYDPRSDSFSPADLTLKEARTCETLLRSSRSPHPNIAEYLGCVIEEEEGVIKGLCFTKYSKTLEQYFDNPDGSVDTRDCLEGTRSGILHLHGLGYIHNDINPSNIMLRGEGDNTPVIIDFDSCEKEGAVPECKRGSIGWEGPCDTAERSNDMAGLSLIARAFEDLRSAGV